jgi:hypothetical protein
MSNSRTAPDMTLNVTTDPIPATQPAVPAAPSALRASGSSRGASSTGAVVTEAEVLFATAAAVPLPRERTRRRLVAVLHRTFAIRADVRGDRNPRPQRLVYLEGARMARAMEKL